MKKMKNLKCWQQGDVIGIKLSSPPAGEVKVVSKRNCVVAHGESGHSHVVEDEEAELLQIGEKMILSLKNPATLMHEEHGPITLDAGIWEVGQVKEFDYLSMMTRTVQD